MSRTRLVAAAVGILLTQASLAAFAQSTTTTTTTTQILATPAQSFVARANVSVENDSPVPQTIAGTGVVPFQLMPHQQAQLDMSVTPPPVATAPGASVPVRFEYSVGQSAGPQCHGNIDMSLNTQGAADGHYQVTNCVAHSLGTDGATCKIAVSAQNAICHGALAFSAR
ncbi:MAG TPA: hypothetical protein VNF04_01425 [Stellaceae bacterium]|nr:hypothetical protein [Stellaceae bacterium]